MKRFLKVNRPCSKYFTRDFPDSYQTNKCKGTKGKLFALERKRSVSRIGGDGIGDGHTRIREDGGGKYGTPGAGVIIYLAPEIGPADTAGRFNGRTMLELTKTKTKHQLGDFFFHLSFSLRLAAGPSRSPSLSAPRVKEEDRREVHTLSLHPYLSIRPLSSPLLRVLFSSPLHRLSLASFHALSSLNPRQPSLPRCKPYAPFGAQVAAHCLR